MKQGSPLFLLFLVFLVLRLTGTIDWSWWLVTLPLWGPLLVGLLGIALAFVVWAVILLIINSQR